MGLGSQTHSPVPSYGAQTDDASSEQSPLRSSVTRDDHTLVVVGILRNLFDFLSISLSQHHRTRGAGGFERASPGQTEPGIITSRHRSAAVSRCGSRRARAERAPEAIPAAEPDRVTPGAKPNAALHSQSKPDSLLRLGNTVNTTGIPQSYYKIQNKLRNSPEVGFCLGKYPILRVSV